ncbi:MAG: thioredoxin-disulfide reductase [archaeon]
MEKGKKAEQVAIIGSGSAGLTAAIYCARADLSPLVVTGYEEGGQLTLTTAVENFPGFSAGVLGPSLMQEMRKQAEKFGAKFIFAKAVSFSKGPGIFKIGLDSGEEVIARAVIAATGASARFLGIPGEKELVGKGVSTCATCDAHFYRGKGVAVVGGGDSACEEALHLAKFAESVTLIHRRDKLRASKIMQERLLSNPKVSIIWDSAVEKVSGSEKLESILLKNLKTGETRAFPVDGLFLAVGHIPNTEIFKGLVEMNELGYLKSGKSTATNVPGFFAAGDVADPRYRQAITAAGEGCKAALEAERYLTEQEV